MPTFFILYSTHSSPVQSLFSVPPRTSPRLLVHAYIHVKRCNSGTPASQICARFSTSFSSLFDIIGTMTHGIQGDGPLTIRQFPEKAEVFYTHCYVTYNTDGARSPRGCMSPPEAHFIHCHKSLCCQLSDDKTN